MTGSVLEHYDYIKDKNERLLLRREREVFEKSPEMERIAMELREIGLSLAACCLNPEIDIDGLVDEAKERTEELHRRQEEILIYLGYPADYLQNIYDCPLCKDTGLVDERPCKCYHEYKARLSYKASNLSSTMDRHNFDTFDYSLYSDESLDRSHPLYSPETRSLRDYMRAVVNSLKGFIDSGVQLGAYLYGSTGVGKTFLCSCLAKYAIDRFQSVRYYSMNQFIEILNAYKFEKDVDREVREESARAYRELYEVDILILDDLGSELSNRFVIAELFSVINERLGLAKKTVISSNISTQHISDNFDERIASRILGEYDLYYIDGRDLRVHRPRK